MFPFFPPAALPCACGYGGGALRVKIPASWWALALLCAGFSAYRARAQPPASEAPAPNAAPVEKKSVVVFPFESSPRRVGEKVRARALRSLRKSGKVTVLSQRVAQSSAAQAQSDLETNAGRRLVARKLGVAAWIEGRVSVSGSRWSAVIDVMNGGDGRLLAEWVVQGSSEKSVGRKVERHFWEHLGPALEQARAPDSLSRDLSLDEKSHLQEIGPPEAPPPPDPKVEEARERAAEKREQEAFAQRAAKSLERPQALEILTAFGWMERRLALSDALFPQSPTYHLRAAPAFHLHLRWYPWAHFTHTFFAHLGIDLQFGMGVTPSEQNGTAVAYPTRVWNFGIGGRGRIPLGRHELVGVLGYGMEGYAFADRGIILQPLYPDTLYRFVRASVEGKFILAPRWAARVALGWSMVLDAGQLQTEAWLPDSYGGGIEGRVGIGYRFHPRLELEVGALARRYAFSKGSRLANPLAVGLAADRSFYAFLGLLWTMPNTP